MLPTGISIGRPVETPAPVELASYVKAAEKAAADRPAGQRRKTPAVSAAALDDPGPIVSASQFTRSDLPVFLLKKLDGPDEPLP